MMKESLKNLIVKLLFGLIAIILFCCLVFLTFVNSAKNVLKASDDVHYLGNKNNNFVSLMINVYWGEEYLDGMLETLDKHGVKATFFVGGLWVSKNPEMLLKIFEKGHEIANHGYFHKSQDKLNWEQNKQEIQNTHNLVKKYVGIDMNLFAPPSGAYSQTTVDVCHSLGYETIMWSKDTIDWRDKDTNLIIKRASSKNQNGDLILMHPTKNTEEALDDIITNILSQNFKIVCVSQNISVNII